MSTSNLAPLIAFVCGYLFGSLSFAVIVSRAMGLADPRSYGSGNPGASNVLRSGNRSAALLTLALDAVKGFVPPLLVLWLAPSFGVSAAPLAWGAALAGLGAFVGHLWPVFFRFEGGKGVATAAGVLFALAPLLGAATLATWLVIAFFFRYSSLASMIAAVFAPLYGLFIWGPGPIAAVSTIMALLLVWRHAANIKRLLAGTESKFGHKADLPT